MHRFLNLADLSNDDVAALAARAVAAKAGDIKRLAEGKTLGLLFLNPSLRTRVSMVGAWTALGGGCVDLAPGQGMWALATDDKPMLGGEAEHIEEAAGVLGRLCHTLGVRVFAEGKKWEVDRRDDLIAAFADHCGCPLVNMESSLYHPCQALADWVTLDEHGIQPGERFVLSWAYHPKALPMAVPNSTLLMAAQRGMQVTLLRPEGYSLDPEITARAHQLAAASGGSVEESSDPAALKGARVVYAKSWGSLEHYGDADAERALQDQYRNWCVGGEGLPVDAGTKLMHCLPVRRDVVVSTKLLKSADSLILDQAENRKWAQLAVLEQMAG